MMTFSKTHRSVRALSILAAVAAATPAMAQSYEEVGTNDPYWNDVTSTELAELNDNVGCNVDDYVGGIRYEGSSYETAEATYAGGRAWRCNGVRQMRAYAFPGLAERFEEEDDNDPGFYSGYAAFIEALNSQGTRIGYAQDATANGSPGLNVNLPANTASLTVTAYLIF